VWLKEINAAVEKNPADVSVSFGSILGKMNEKPQQKDGKDPDFTLRCFIILASFC